MNKAVPWKITGVDVDARSAAAEAARRSGKGLGEWLWDVIAEQAAADGVREDDLDADGRLQAVRRRLRDLRGDGGPAAVDHDEDTGREDMRRKDVEAEGDPESRGRRIREQVGAEATLEDAIAAFDRRTNRSSERTARALAEVADLIDTTNRGRENTERALAEVTSLLDTTQRERERDGAALATIADRLSSVEERVSRAPEPKADPSVQHALSRLEQRIEALSGEPAPRAPRIVEPLAPRPAPVQAPPAAKRGKRPLAAAIAEVAQRQMELDGVAPSATGRPAAPRPPQGVPSALERRLTALAERLERSAGLPPEPVAPEPAAPAVSIIQGRFNDLAERLEAMRGEMAARGAEAEPAGADEVRQIRGDLAAMSQTLADLAPRSSVDALERAVRDLAARVELSRMDGIGEASLAPLEKLARDLRSAVHDLDPRPSLDALGREIQSVAAKLEKFDGVAIADPELAKALVEQMRDMRDTLAQVLGGQLPAERIGAEVADLGRRIDRIAAAGTDPVGLGQMAQRVSEIRALLADPLPQERMLHVLERGLEAVAGRVDAVFGTRLDTIQRNFEAELTQARTVADTRSVDALMGDVTGRIDAALASGLQAMESRVSRMITDGAPDSQSARLEAMVRDLAARIEANAAPGYDPAAVEGLQKQVELLARHLDKGDRTTDTLLALERMVADLFARTEQTKHLAIDAAEQAGRAAAEDALRALSAMAGTEEGAALGVAALRDRREESDTRTHATLNAVHHTLERVVDRLGALEDDLADMRSRAPGDAPRKAEPARAVTAPQPARGEAASAPLPDSDILIEPGAFGRRRNASATEAEEEDLLEYRPQASFIQAARRAAKAAAGAVAGEAEPAKAAGAGKAGLVLDPLRLVAQRKRPILLGVAALLMVCGVLGVAKMASDDRSAAREPAAQSKLPPAPPAREKIADKPPAPAPAVSAPVTPAPATDGPADAAPPARKADLAVPAVPMVQPQAPVLASAAPPVAIDRAPVATIPPRAEPADTNGIVRALALTGDSAAQFELASRYAEGRLLARDPKLALQWFEKAAAKGVAPAQYRLGAMYERGVGVNKDAALAKQWYLRAAEAGNARAMHNLAVMHADGSSGKPDYPNALTWFKRAAQLGVRDSQYNLAILSARGLGSSPDLVESFLWFDAAANQGDADAGKKRDEVAARLAPNDLARAKALAASFKAGTPDPAANEAPAAPSGGWEAVQLPPRPDSKPADGKPADEKPTAAKPKMSRL